MEKERNVIFFDVDGTLFRHDCRVPASTVESIQRCVERGNIAILCTGRGASTIPAEVQALPMHGAIYSCGTYVTLDKDVVVNAAVEGDDCQKILSILRKYRCPFFVENPDYFYYDPDYLPNGFDRVIDTMHRNYPGRFQYISTLPNRISKMTGYPEDRSLIPDLVRELSVWFEVIVHKEYSYIEITLKDYSKGTGVNKILELLQTDKSHSYAFGDSGNDITMLESVGCGIVMGDSPDYLKERFTPTDSIYENGIANALRKFKLI